MKKDVSKRKSDKRAKTKNGKTTAEKTATKQPVTKKLTTKKTAQPKHTSALDAAAMVLKKSGKPMRSRELIVAMTEQKLWTSPKGNTPHATLYAAMIREVATKGKNARFKKVERGLFELNG